MDTYRVLALSLLALALLMEHAVPYFQGRRLFGVTVPREVRRGSTGKKLIRCYELRLLPWTMASLLAAILLPVVWSAISALIISDVAMICTYARACNAARHFASSNELHEAALSDTSGDLQRVVRHFLPPWGIMATVALYVHARWDQIPSRFAVHWTADGIPNGWADKTTGGIYGPLLFAALVILVLADLSLVMLLGSSRRHAASATLSLLTVVAYTITTGFSFPAIMALLSVRHLPMEILVAIFIAVMLIYFMLLNRAISRVMRTRNGTGRDRNSRGD